MSRAGATHGETSPHCCPVGVPATGRPVVGDSADAEFVAVGILQGSGDLARERRCQDVDARTANRGRSRPRLVLSAQCPALMTKERRMMQGTTRVSNRYRLLSHAFAEKVDAVPEDAWTNPSPCPGWTAEDVLRHVNDTSQGFLELAGIASPVSHGGRSMIGQWTELRDQIIVALETPAAAISPVSMGGGEQTFETVTDRYLCPDLLIHGWDIARACGMDEDFDPELVSVMLIQIEEMAPTRRRMGAFGDEVPVPDDADQLTRLLALAGRQI